MIISDYDPVNFPNLDFPHKTLIADFSTFDYIGLISTYYKKREKVNFYLIETACAVSFPILFNEMETIITTNNRNKLQLLGFYKITQELLKVANNLK